MCPIIAPSNYVWDGSSSRSTHAAVCEVMWWVWIIRLVAEQVCPFMTVALLTSAFKDPTMLKHNAIVFFIKFTIFLSILILPLFGFANISCQISYINKVLLDLTSIFIKKYLCHRWMLCGFALRHRCIWPVWDFSESPRWGNGLHTRTCQSSCAQGQASNAGEDLWWVTWNWSSFNLCLACTITSH